jgi:hypothetical protein
MRISSVARQDVDEGNDRRVALRVIGKQGPPHAPAISEVLVLEVAQLVSALPFRVGPPDGLHAGPWRSVFDASVSRFSEVVFEGTPADVLAARSALTGEHLAAYVGT